MPEPKKWKCASCEGTGEELVWESVEAGDSGFDEPGWIPCRDCRPEEHEEWCENNDLDSFGA